MNGAVWEDNEFVTDSDAPMSIKKLLKWDGRGGRRENAGRKSN